jgi:hypothetical protein
MSKLIDHSETFRKFQATRLWSDDLREHDIAEVMDAEAEWPQPGFIYKGTLHIEQVTADWPDSARARGDWHLILGRDEYVDDLEPLEELLYEFAVGEGIVDQTAARLELETYMKKNGFVAEATGGGCMTWAKDLGDGSAYWICDDNGRLGTALTKSFSVGRYGTVDGGHVDYSGSYVTPYRAVEDICPHLPHPALPGEKGLEGQMTLDEAKATLALQKADYVETEIPADREETYTLIKDLTVMQIGYIETAMIRLCDYADKFPGADIGNAIAVDYPFGQSLDEVVLDVQRWKEAVGKELGIAD